MASEKTRVPWDDLSDREKENFRSLLHDLGIKVSVSEAERYYGNRDLVEQEATVEVDKSGYACPTCFGPIDRRHLEHLKETGECPHCGEVLAE